MKHKATHKLQAANAWLNKHLPLLFVIIAAVAGIAITFRITPLFGSDEIVHFPRAYQISEGTLWTDKLEGYEYGGQVPQQVKWFNDDFRQQVQNDNPDSDRIAELTQRYTSEKVSNEKREVLGFTSAGVYSPWAYLPSALGVSVARVLDTPIAWYVYAARLACLALWILLTYLALRLLPFGRPLLFVVALLPVSLVQAVTMGMDGVVNGLSWLLIAFTVAIVTKKIRITPKILGLLAFLSLFLATTKQGYLLIALLPLIIPNGLFPYKPKKVWWLRGGFVVVLGLVTLWYLSVTSPIASIMHFIQRPGINVDSTAQLQYIIQNPFAVLGMIFVQPFTVGYAGVYAGFIGILTNRSIFVPVWLMIGLYALLVSQLLRLKGDKPAYKYATLLRSSAVLVWLGTFILINLALYVSFTKVGLEKVEGLQGRYFLPLAPLMIVFQSGAKRSILDFKYRYDIITTVAVVCVSIVITYGIIR